MPTGPAENDTDPLGLGGTIEYVAYAYNLDISVNVEISLRELDSETS